MLAKGKKPVDGQDARIEYYFNTDVDLKPKKNEDGSVDYRELNVISYINEGDLLAKLFPEDRGIKGYDVQGREIKPKQVRSLQLEYGNNIRVSEDKTELYSEVTGHASLVMVRYLYQMSMKSRQTWIIPPVILIIRETLP